MEEFRIGQWRLPHGRFGSAAVEWGPIQGIGTKSSRIFKAGWVSGENRLPHDPRKQTRKGHLLADLDEAASRQG